MATDSHRLCDVRSTGGTAGVASPRQIVPAGRCLLKGLIIWDFPMVLAIDIGGTKFSMAVFDGDAIVRRESRATAAPGGRQWMVSQIAEIVGALRREVARATGRLRV